MTYYISKKRTFAVDCYHTNPECYQLENGFIQKPESFIQFKGLDECKVCAGKSQSNNGGSQKYQNILKNHE